MAGVRRQSLSRFYLESVQKARLYIDRAFHSLVTLQRLAIWGLGPEPSTKVLPHKLTVRRGESSSFSFLSLLFFFFFF